MIILANCSLITYGQKENTIMAEIKEFYCEDWLFEFPDTILVYLEYDSLPKSTKYSEVKKGKNNSYDLTCWSGEKTLETPSQINERLKIIFKDNRVIFRLGMLRTTYVMNKVKGKIALVKKV